MWLFRFGFASPFKPHVSKRGYSHKGWYINRGQVTQGSNVVAVIIPREKKDRRTKMGRPIRVAIAGIGNCANSLISGVQWYKEFYAKAKPGDLIPGLVHETIGDYKVTDIEFVAAFDVDERKVGKDLCEAIFAETNMAYDYGVKMPRSGVTVQMGPVLDGVPEHLANFCIPVKVAKKDPDACNSIVDETGSRRLQFVPVKVCGGLLSSGYCVFPIGVV